jgi:hypothetical protein
MLSHDLRGSWTANTRVDRQRPAPVADTAAIAAEADVDAGARAPRVSRSGRAGALRASARSGRRPRASVHEAARVDASG